MSDFTFLVDLCSPIKEITPGSIISRTLVNSEKFEAVLFGMDGGQQLKQAESRDETMLYFVRGEVDLQLGADSFTAQPCSWLHIEPGIPHQVHAVTPATFLLVLIKP